MQQTARRKQQVQDKQRTIYQEQLPRRRTAVIPGDMPRGKQTAYVVTVLILPDTEKLRELLRSRLTRNYPYSYGARLPAKLSVSALHPGILDEAPAPSPSDAERYASMLSETVGAGYSPPDGYMVSDEDMPFGYITDENTFNTDRPEHESLHGCEAAPTGGSDDAPVLKGLKRPRFLEGTEHIADGAERGTATHVFLQFCNWDSVCSDGIEAERDRMVRSRIYDGGYGGADIRADAAELFRKQAV